MKFHKNYFPIQTIIKDEKIMVVSGWVDETNTYGFYKNGKTWKATDLRSGTLITVQLTRKVCAEWIEENSQKILDKKTTLDYMGKVKSFYMLLEEELQNA